MEKAWTVGEIIWGGSYALVWEDENGYFLQHDKNEKEYIDLEDYDIMYY
jgi:hypothetical protein